MQAARASRPLTVPLDACGFSTATTTGLAIPGLGDHLPEGALVLFVPGGSFEQVTLYLGVLHGLRELGVTVWNDARAIERCVDKSTTTFFLQSAGIPTPWTFAGANRDEAAAIAATKLAEGHKLVQKPLFGAQGKGLRLIASLADLAPPEEVNGVYYLQEFVPPAQQHHQDWRIFVCRRPRRRRYDQAWVELDHQHQARRPRRGRDPRARSLPISRCAPPLASAPTMPASISSRTVTARFLVLEVNTMPAWNGLQRVTRTRIADQWSMPSSTLPPDRAAARPRGRVSAQLTATRSPAPSAMPALPSSTR